MLLYAAYTTHPYSYYTLLKWVCFIGYGYLAFAANEQKNTGLMILWLGLLLMMNPIIKVRLSKDIWDVVDYVASGITVLSIAIDLMRKKVD